MGVRWRGIGENLRIIRYCIISKEIRPNWRMNYTKYTDRRMLTLAR